MRPSTENRFGIRMFWTQGIELKIQLRVVKISLKSNQLTTFQYSHQDFALNIQENLSGTLKLINLSNFTEMKGITFTYIPVDTFHIFQRNLKLELQVTAELNKVFLLVKPLTVFTYPLSLNVRSPQTSCYDAAVFLNIFCSFSCCWKGKMFWLQSWDY